MSRIESLQNSEKQSAIYSYLAKNGASRPSDVARGLDCTRQSIHNALKRLEKKGIGYLDLNICDDGDSWEKLCSFLDRLIPNEDFPHEQ